MGSRKISEQNPAATVNDSDLFVGVQNNNGTFDNAKYTAGQLKTYFQDGLQEELTFDDIPTVDSDNPVKSSGLFNQRMQYLHAFADRINKSEKGAANGVAELDSSGKVISSQLPSYVDDVLEFASRSIFPVFGEGGKIYIAIDTNLSYRWTGNGYAEISPSIALGETSSTAYRGDRGKVAYDFSQTPYTSNPLMNGAPSAGSSSSWARGDHRHPRDTSKQDVLTFDDQPMANSSNPVKSSGVYNSLIEKQDTLIFDDEPAEDSDNPVKSSGIYDMITSLADDLRRELYPSGVAEGAIASFSDGAKGAPIKSIIVSIEAVQEGSGDPSSSNIRPISGFSGVTITRVGKNLFRPYTSSSTVGGVTLDPNPDGSFSLQGSASANAFVATTRPPFEIKSETMLSYSLGNDIINNEVGLRVVRSGPGSRYGTLYRAISENYTESGIGNFNFDGNGLQAVVASNHGAVPKITLKPQIEFGSTATEWEPYSEEKINISWENICGTIYGASLDVTSGILTVTREYIASYAGEELPGEWISDRDVYESGTTPSIGAQVVYDPGETVIYFLDGATLHTLLGVNHISSDAGSVRVEYSADIKLYIDKKLSELSAP